MPRQLRPKEAIKEGMALGGHEKWMGIWPKEALKEALNCHLT